MTDFETLDITGFNVVAIGHDFTGTTLSADFGSGYKATAVVGRSVREWELACDVLLDLADEPYLINAGEHGLQTRLQYLWDFYERHMAAGCKPFWFRDERERRAYLVEFVDVKLTLDVFTSAMYGAGFTLRQRRVRGVEGVGGETAEVNPDAI